MPGLPTLKPLNDGQQNSKEEQSDAKPHSIKEQSDAKPLKDGQQNTPEEQTDAKPHSIIAEAKPRLHRGKSGIFQLDRTYGGDELFSEGVENGIAAVDLFAKANAPSIETKAEESKFPLPTVPACVNEAITTARTQCLRVTPEEQWALSKQKRAEMADKGGGKGDATTSKQKRKLDDERRSWRRR